MKLKILRYLQKAGKKKKFWIFASFVIPSAFIGIFIHEFLGHALTGVLLGGKFERFTLFSGGVVAQVYISGLGQSERGIMLLAGSLVNFGASAAIAFLLMSRIRNFWLRALGFWTGIWGALDFPFYAIFGALGIRHWIIIGGVGEPQLGLELLRVPEILAPIIGALMLPILIKYYQLFGEMLLNITVRKD